VIELPDGVTLTPEGAAAFRGPALALLEALDGHFVELASAFGARPFAATPLSRVADLRRLDYFSSFPQLVLAPVGPHADAASVAEFARNNHADVDGPLRLESVCAPHVVLAPAACYALYPALRGLVLGSEPQRYTLRSFCFRREREPEPLRRQLVFQMREVVQIGTAAQATPFLEAAEQRALELAQALDLRVRVEVATDPFFDPARSPRFLHQKLFPTKRELLFEDLALGSFNLHRAFFGSAFELSAAGAPAFTACAAFGLERWMWAIARQHGADIAGWPSRLRPR
jgi:seryl-tRNA synthetase